MAKYKRNNDRDFSKSSSGVDVLDDPKWIEENKDRLMKALGIDKIVSEAEMNAETRTRKEIEEAAAELGIDLNEKEAGVEDNPAYDSMFKLVQDTARYIDLLRQSTDWANLMTVKEKALFEGVRAFCAQLGVPNVKGRPQSVKELLSTVKVQGPTGHVVRHKKPIRLTDDHLREAGIGV